MANALTISPKLMGDGTYLGYTSQILDGSTVVLSYYAVSFAYNYTAEAIVLKDSGIAFLTITPDNVLALTGETSLLNVFNNIINI